MLPILIFQLNRQYANTWCSISLHQIKLRTYYSYKCITSVIVYRYTWHLLTFFIFFLFFFLNFHVSITTELN